MPIKKQGDIPVSKTDTKAKRQGEDKLSEVLTESTRDIRTTPNQSTDQKKD